MATSGGSPIPAQHKKLSMISVMSSSNGGGIQTLVRMIELNKSVGPELNLASECRPSIQLKSSHQSFILDHDRKQVTK